MIKNIKLIIITFIYMIIYFVVTPLVNDLLLLIIKNEEVYFYVSYILTFIIMLFVLLIFNKYQKVKPINTNQIFKGLLYLSPFLILFISTNLLAGVFNSYSLTSNIFKSLILAFVPAFSEEVVYRSNNVLSILDENTTYKEVLSYAFVSALLFSLVHFVNMLAGANFSITLYQVAYAFSFGMLSSAVLIKTKNIVSNVLGHSLFNFSGFIYEDILQSEGVLNETVELNIVTIFMLIIMFMFVLYAVRLIKKNYQN